MLKTLMSSKAPMIKKRQAMRNTFGDYRKKMRDSEKKSTAGKDSFVIYIIILLLHPVSTNISGLSTVYI